MAAIITFKDFYEYMISHMNTIEELQEEMDDLNNIFIEEEYSIAEALGYSTDRILWMIEVLLAREKVILVTN